MLGRHEITPGQRSGPRNWPWWPCPLWLSCLQMDKASEGLFNSVFALHPLITNSFSNGHVTPLEELLRKSVNGCSGLRVWVSHGFPVIASKEKSNFFFRCLTFNLRRNEIGWVGVGMPTERREVGDPGSGSLLRLQQPRTPRWCSQDILPGKTSPEEAQPSRPLTGL